MRIHDLDGLRDIRRTGMMKILPGKPRIGVGMGTCGIGNGARAVIVARWVGPVYVTFTVIAMLHLTAMAQMVGNDR